eukprot:148475-Alexandrium_andersonii.AAC.1
MALSGRSDTAYASHRGARSCRHCPPRGHVASRHTRSGGIRNLDDWPRAAPLGGAPRRQAGHL